jgi:hypothetical protein
VPVTSRIAGLPSEGTRRFPELRTPNRGTQWEPFLSETATAISRNFATISSGRYFFRRLVIESLLARRAEDHHAGKIRIPKTAYQLPSRIVRGYAVQHQNVILVGTYLKLLGANQLLHNSRLLLAGNRVGASRRLDQENYLRVLDDWEVVKPFSICQSRTKTRRSGHRDVFWN